MVTPLTTGVLKNIDQYLTPDFCLSCAYFKQAKGNYGTCSASSIEQRKFDGSRKGSACSGWRINSRLIKSLPIAEVKQDLIEEMRLIFNRRAKKKRLFISRKAPASIVYFAKENKSKRHLAGLPFDKTTDLSKPKKGFYQHKKPKTIIKYALSQIKQKKSTRQISRSILEIFNISVSHVTINRWAREILKERHDEYWQRVGQSRARVFFNGISKAAKKEKQQFIKYRSIAIPRPVFTLCPYCKNDRIVRNGWSTVTKTDSRQKYRCNTCHRTFVEPARFKKVRAPRVVVEYILKMAEQGISANRISINLEKEFDFKITRMSVIRIAKRFQPELKFPKGRPHDPIWKMKIRIACEQVRQNSRK